MKNNINNIDYKNLGYIKKYISEGLMRVSKGK